MNYAIDSLMRAAEDAERDRETHAEELAELTAERDEARAEVRRLTAALAVMRGDLGDTNALADGHIARLRAEHAAALATARREGAEEMRRAAGQVCHDVYLEDPSAAVAVCIDAIRALPLDAPGGGS